MNNRILLIFAGIFIFFINSIAIASYPRGCEATGFSYSQNFLTLNATGEQTFYLIQNKSQKSLEVERYETREVFMSPKMKSTIAAGRWSAFACDVENLHLKCLSKEGDSTTPVNCEDVIDICQYPRVKFALSNMGNYWVSQNKTQKGAIKEAIKKGILLRW